MQCLVASNRTHLDTEFNAFIKFGKHFLACKDYSTALGYFQKATAIDTENAEAWAHLGITLWNLLSYQEALECLKKSNALDNKQAPTHYNLARLYTILKEPELALQHFDSSIQIDHTWLLSKVNKGFLLLSLGKFKEGFSLLEQPRRKDFHDIKLPRLERYQCLSNKKILLINEQGLGDQILMYRFLPRLEANGVEIWIQAPETLSNIIKRSFPSIHVESNDFKGESLDFCIHTMSLPYLLDISSENEIGSDKPYLEIDPEKIGRWREKIPTTYLFKVSLTWRGNPQFPNDRLRSIKFESILPLFEIRDIFFVVVQKDITPNEREQLKAYNNVMIATDEIKDFEDSAAIMKNMDLVISVDTSVANMAGALSLNGWIMLTVETDWRWMGPRKFSPWYPTLELFHQQKGMEWDPLVNEIKTRLQGLCVSRFKA